MGPEFWLLVALVILIVAVRKPLARTVLGGLDGYAAKVRDELDEAKRLREEAQQLLAEHQRKLAQGEDQASQMVEQARIENERHVKRHQDELEASIQRRREAAEQRIAQEEARAVQELRAQAARLTIQTTERLLAEQMDDEQRRQMVDHALEEIGRKLH
jgi:F-type H+-transporting ATPase subunit b